MNRWSRPASFMLVLGLVATGVSVVAAATPAAAAPASGTYHAATPKRILDTRYGIDGAKAGAIPANQAAVLQVAGLPSVPTGASAVVLNVTVTVPTNRGYITVYPDGQARPTTSNLNFVPGQTVPSLVVVALPSNGRIRLHNGSDGAVQLIADVSGYYTGANAPSGQGAFGAISPRRILDTRSSNALPQPPVASMKSVSFQVTGTDVPPGVSAVVLNVTVTAPESPGFISAYPSGGPVPAASNLNFLRSQTVPNLVVVPVGAGGKVSLFNGSPGTAHLLADISGYFLAGDPVTAGTLGALSPLRLLDTRNATGGPASAVAPLQTRTMSVRGRGGVPLAGGGAVVLNVTVTAPTAAGYLTVYGGSVRPVVSNLNFSKGQTVPNLVVAQVSTSGTVTFYNGSTGTVHILADVSGYIPRADAPLPATSTSHYVRGITGVAASDGAKMQTQGCTDARAGSAFVLLVIGAQSNRTGTPSSNGTVLNDANPGVRLTNPDRAVRLTYPQLRVAVDAYTQGFSTCSTAAATVAVGTNTSGSNFAEYSAEAKGTDWANEVIDKLAPRPRVTIVGANDIEASFGSTYAQAAAWVTSYLTATTSTTSKLVYAGSADNCPVTYGAIGECGAVKGQVGPTWTRANYVSLTRGLAPTRITALPQIYYSFQAVQWANIDTTARAAGGAIVFAGALTENASACGADCAMQPSHGWAALNHALSTVATVPSLPVVTDLQVDF